MPRFFTATFFWLVTLETPATLATATTAPAQPSRSASLVVVSGIVKDLSGAVLPGASVDALVAGLSVATTATGADGRYRIELAPATRHHLRARLAGFADETIDLRTPSDAASHDFVLKIAGLSDTVVVTPARMGERDRKSTRLNSSH